MEQRREQPQCYVKSSHEDDIIALFKAYDVDLIVLAGWMRIIKNPESFPAPMINVHPSLLPKYKGLHAVEQAMKAGEEYTGCTVHYVNEELDGGEIIIQKEVPILDADDVESLTKAEIDVHKSIKKRGFNSWTIGQVTT